MALAMVTEVWLLGRTSVLSDQFVASEVLRIGSVAGIRYIQHPPVRSIRFCIDSLVQPPAVSLL